MTSPKILVFMRKRKKKKSYFSSYFSLASVLIPINFRVTKLCKSTFLHIFEKKYPFSF